MKMRALLLSLVTMGPVASLRANDVFDRVEELLTIYDEKNDFRARVSGSLELEAFFPSEPVSDLLFSDRSAFFNPRLTLFLDAQWGARVYGFAQARLDHGFDPAGSGPFRPRLDEYALRFTPWSDGRLNVQVGQFATVVGQWARRHTAWEHPFITAPLAYDNLTAIWDRLPATTSGTLLGWGHVRPISDSGGVFADKHERLPIIWGPSYATGAALSRLSGRFEYAIEVKNAALSSRPDVWNEQDGRWRHPTVSGRVAWRPNPAWNLGVSASAGPYLLPSARSSIPAGTQFSDYRQLVIAQDVSFAWRHWQVWAEAHAARFEVPRVGDADTLAYFVEAKYKVTPQLSAALRWNQQTFGRITTSSGKQVRWGREVWRVDFAPTYRFTPHVQLKVQFSLRHEEPAISSYTHAVATQLTVRF